MVEGKDRGPVMETLRKRANLSQEQLAQALGVTDHTYRNWLKGRSKPELSIEMVKTLCKVLGVELDELPNDFTETLPG